MLEHNAIYSNLLDYLFEVSLKTMFQDIIHHLTSKQNVKLEALSGMGLNNFTGKIRHSLKQAGAIVVDIYPHDSTLSDYQKITAMLLAKIAIDFPDLDAKNIDEVYQVLPDGNRRLVLILNKIQQFVNVNLYLDFFDSIYRHSPSVTILITNTPGWGQLQSHNLLTSCRWYVFPGFIATFSDYIDELEQAFTWKISPKKRQQVYQLALGHAGLIKTILQLQNETSTPLSVDELITDQEINLRLTNLFQSVAEIGLENFYSAKIKLKYGLSDGHNIGKLWERYFQQFKNNQEVTNNLTETERKIFEYLLSRKSTYTTVDEIIGFIAPSAYDTKTNWSLYKHISNLSKKITPHGYRLEGKRSIGYRLYAAHQNGHNTPPPL